METDDTENNEHSGISRIFNLKSSDKLKNSNVMLAVKNSEKLGLINKTQAEMIENILEFQHIDVEDIMTHRVDIKAADSECEIADILDISISSGFSRIPIFKGDIDNIIGAVNVKDLLVLIGQTNSLTKKIEPYIRELLFVPKSVKCFDLFNQLNKNHEHMAVIFDEYGGTSGIATLEDLIEIIMGKIQDEYDNESEDIVEETKNSYILKGTVSLKTVNNLLNINIKESINYDTIGGFLVDRIGRIPEKDEKPSILFNNIKFDVMNVSKQHISKIRVTIIT